MKNFFKKIISTLECTIKLILKLGIIILEAYALALILRNHINYMLCEPALGLTNLLLFSLAGRPSNLIGFTVASSIPMVPHIKAPADTEGSHGNQLLLTEPDISMRIEKVTTGKAYGNKIDKSV